MSNNRIVVLCVLLLVFMSGIESFSAPAFAQMMPSDQVVPAPDQESSGQDAAPVLEQPPVSAPKAVDEDSVRGAGGPLTVTDVIIDKTDKNAVTARDQAIIEAQRTAFEVLAEKSMSPEAFKAYKVPDNKTIAALVEDFEIKNEQMSANRYVASFTVRFTPEIDNYIKIPAGLGRVIVAPQPVAPSVAAAPATTESAAAPAAPAPATPPAPDVPRSVLILPYFEGASGKKVLWEDPNPWRDAWQEVGSSAPTPNLTISVPLGDLTDVSSGNTDAVWKNDYGTIEKSRTNYNATEVALLVAHQGKGIDVYIYKDGKLEREKSVGGKYSDQDSYKKAIKRVIAALKSPQPFAVPTAVAPEATAPETNASGSDNTAPPPAEPEQASPAAPEKPEMAGKVTIDAVMNFSNFSQWMEVQKRLAALSPPVDIEISGITRDSAQFTMDYDGGMTALKTALSAKGLALGSPVVDVDESVLGSDKPTQKTVYELRLQN